MASPKYNGNAITAIDIGSGLIFLNILGLHISPELTKNNFKWKLDLPTTPPKGSKIPIHSPT